MGWIDWFKDFLIDRKTSRLMSRAIDCQYAKDFTASALAWSEYADLQRQTRYGNGCSANGRFDAAEMWILANEPQKAVEQTCMALAIFERRASAFDDEDLDKLMQIVNHLRQADHIDETDALVTDINKFLVSQGKNPIEVAVVGTQKKFPPSCPHCGGTISYHGTLDVINCPFCGSAVHAI